MRALALVVRDRPPDRMPYPSESYLVYEDDAGHDRVESLGTVLASPFEIWAADDADGTRRCGRPSRGRSCRLQLSAFPRAKAVAQ